MVRLYWPVALRPAFDALFAIDDAMGDVVANSTQPALAAIKLAWWREALERLDHAPPPPEPRLQAVARELLQLGVTGSDLAGLEQGWAALLDESPDPALAATRGERVFAIGGRLLEADHPRLGDAGALWALVDDARRGYPALPDDANNYREAVAGQRFPRAIRPLNMLARLAARDLALGPPFEPRGAPVRAAAMLAHRLSGVVARG